MSRLAAVWARVSTTGQTETSLPSQVARVRSRLEDEGYEVPPAYVIAIDWSSLDLFACPDFQRLRRWIQNKEIEAVGILDRDRLEAKGLQRLIFLSDCREAGVKVVICQGSPLLDGPEGEIVELALAVGKERSVLRARQGAKDGLHDRVKRRYLPTSHHKVFGYRWDGDRKLVPDHNWDVTKLIFDTALQGKTYHPIIKELEARGILSPSGMSEWNKAAISSILHNPIYAGRYYALKKRAVKPVKRRGNTYGNSSTRILSLEQAVYLSQVEIVSPPITWEQRLQILDQLKKHQKLAQRNARTDYLLRGLIFCETHRGKRGEPRRYHGRPHSSSWCYVCPVSGDCPYPYLNGPRIESWVKNFIRMSLMSKTAKLEEFITDKLNKEESEESLSEELSDLKTKYVRNVDAETELENRSLMKQVHEEVYQRLKAKFQIERQWIEEKQKSITADLSQLSRKAEALASLGEVRSRFAHRLDNLTKGEWRELLTTLNFEVHIVEPNYQDLFGKWPERFLKDKNARFLGSVRFHFGVPLTSKHVGEIVLNNHEPD